MARSRRVVSHKVVGQKVVISLACGHAITKAIGYWTSYQGKGPERREDCPQCDKYKQ